MWPAHSISEIEDADGDIISIDVTTPVGIVQIVAQVEVSTASFILEEHISADCGPVRWA